eukprot:6370013-Amphidinium_carterae.1
MFVTQGLWKALSTLSALPLCSLTQFMFSAWTMATSSEVEHAPSHFLFPRTLNMATISLIKSTEHVCNVRGEMTQRRNDCAEE